MRKRGFTIVELVVALSVIAMLISLTIPAVQAARERARAATCASNLKQISLALHNYHSNHNVFPMGSSAFVPKSTSSGLPAGAWGYVSYLLPHLDETPRWRTIRFQSPNCCAEIIQQQTSGERDPVSQPLTVTVCPSDPLGGTAHESGFSTTYPCGRLFPGNYLGISGDQTHGCLGIKNGNGILFSLSSTRASDIRDGLSQTLIVGERGIPSSQSWGWLICGGTECEQYLSTFHGLAPGESGGTTQDADRRFWSWHTGGVHFALADGRVRFLNYSISDSVLAAVSTVRGAESVTQSD
jgi:prepilin-type N-terminal cleavage/methylation domain-containing protein